MRSRKAYALLAAVAVVALGVAAIAVADNGGKKQVKAGTLVGYEENPDLSSPAKGEFHARIDNVAKTITYTLSYSGFTSPVQQAHIHFGKRAINGGISAFLCTNLGNGPAGTQACPQSGTVSGVIHAADVVGPTAQGIAPGEFDELVAAIRAGHAYVNVHTANYPAGEIRAQLDDRNQRDDD